MARNGQMDGGRKEEKSREGCKIEVLKANVKAMGKEIKQLKEKKS